MEACSASSGVAPVASKIFRIDILDFSSQIASKQSKRLKYLQRLSFYKLRVSFIILDTIFCNNYKSNLRNNISF